MVKDKTGSGKRKRKKKEKSRSLEALRIYILYKGSDRKAEAGAVIHCVIVILYHSPPELGNLDSGCYLTVAISNEYIDCVLL